MGMSCKDSDVAEAHSCNEPIPQAADKDLILLVSIISSCAVVLNSLSVSRDSHKQHSVTYLYIYRMLSMQIIQLR